MKEPDFVFLDSANRPWRVAPRLMAYDHVTNEKKSEVWIWSWSVYDRWVPLKECDEIHAKRDYHEDMGRKVLDPWEADLYHKLSEIHQ